MKSWRLKLDEEPNNIKKWVILEQTLFVYSTNDFFTRKLIIWRNFMYFVDIEVLYSDQKQKCFLLPSTDNECSIRYEKVDRLVLRLITLALYILN